MVQFTTLTHKRRLLISYQHSTPSVFLHRPLKQMCTNSIPQHVHCFLQQQWDMFLVPVLPCNSSTFPACFLYILPHVRLSSTEVCNITNRDVWRRITNKPNLIHRHSSQKLNPQHRACVWPVVKLCINLAKVSLFSVTLFPIYNFQCLYVWRK